MENKVIRKNDNLLIKAQAVFGDIVTEAYLVAEFYDYLGEEFVIEELDRLSEVSNSEDIFNVNYIKGVILVFSNGYHVFISTSEWSTFKKVDISNMPQK